MNTKLGYAVRFTLLTSVLVLLLAIPLFWYLYQKYLDEPLNLKEDLVFLVPANSNLYLVAEELGLSGVLSYQKLLVWHARLNKQTEIQAGEYRFEPGITPTELLQQLNSGAVIQYSTALVEGRTFQEILTHLHFDSKIDAQLVGKSDAEIIDLLGIEVAHLEGQFFPDTYAFNRGATDIEILRRAHARMQDVLSEEWVSRGVGLPFDTAYEALILASIVEKETGVGVERPEIAGVFVRRLHKGMRLQTDPTVIYGLGDSYDGNLTRKHLKTETAYNTYRIDGLPPTPIAAAGREAIRAVLQPAEGDSLYFVAKGDGSHQFSATLDEHNAAVRRYQIEQRAENYRSSPSAESSDKSTSDENK